MQVAKITNCIGAEINGLCLQGDQISSDLADDLYALLIEHAVLVIRGLHPSPAAQLALAQNLGELAPIHPLYQKVEGYPDIIRIIDSAQSPPENEEFHADLSYRSHPNFASVMHGVVIPEAGGDTLFSDARAAYDHLPDSTKAMIQELEAEHTMEQGFARLMGRPDQPSRAVNRDAFDHPENRVIHPLVKTHPANGRKILYVNESFTSRIVGFGRFESEALIADLVRHIYKPRYQCRVRWSKGAVVIWDNWATQHYASGDHWPAPREVQRATIITNRRVDTAF